MSLREINVPTLQEKQREDGAGPAAQMSFTFPTRTSLGEEAGEVHNLMVRTSATDSPSPVLDRLWGVLIPHQAAYSNSSVGPGKTCCEGTLPQRRSGSDEKRVQTSE